MYIPFVQRIDRSEWPILLLSLLLIYVEGIMTFVTALLPRQVIQFFDHAVELIFINNPVNGYYNLKKKEGDQIDIDFLNKIKNANSFRELCLLFGYSCQNHLVKTEDGYILTIHRIIPSEGLNALKDRPVIYLHHGLLMNSEVWVTMSNKFSNLPFVLSDLGYDIWLGNNRGNKYSKKHVLLKPDDNKFWDFSIDEFAMYDIPNTINHILDYTSMKSLTYIGFSQGTAQGFASLSIHPELNSKVNGFIALSPAMTPKGLHHPVVDTLMKATPILMFLFFGRKILLSSATFWNSVIYPPLFIRVIDFSNILLFNWYGSNISFDQKILSYSHLYSSTSVKTVVHWFQIIRNKSFQMYDDSFAISPKLSSKISQESHFQTKDYVVPSYPTNNIKVPILLIYGKSDSLVDIDIMLDQLPKNNNVRAVGVDEYEHLEIIWGDRIGVLVFPHILRFLGEIRALLEGGHKTRDEIEEDDDTPVPSITS